MWVVWMRRLDTTTACLHPCDVLNIYHFISFAKLSPGEHITHWKLLHRPTNIGTDHVCHERLRNGPSLHDLLHNDRTQDRRGKVQETISQTIVYTQGFVACVVLARLIFVCTMQVWVTFAIQLYIITGRHQRGGLEQPRT